MDSNLSAADVLALAGNKGMDASTAALLMGNNNNDNGIWNNPFIYLVWLWAMNSFGGFGGMGGAWGMGGLNGYNSPALQGSLTRAELYDGLNTQQITTGIGDIRADIGAQTTNILQGLNGLQASTNSNYYNGSIANLQGFNALERVLCSEFNSVDSDILQNRFATEQGNCNVRSEIMENRYENAQGVASLMNSLNNVTRDVITNQNAGFQKILDRMCEQENQTLRSELQNARNALGNQALANDIINAVRPVSQPAYLTSSPYQAVNYATGCGCGS